MVGFGYPFCKHDIAGHQSTPLVHSLVLTLLNINRIDILSSDILKHAKLDL